MILSAIVLWAVLSTQPPSVLPDIPEVVLESEPSIVPSKNPILEQIVSTSNSQTYTDEDIAKITADTPMKPGAFSDPKVQTAFAKAYKKRDAEEQANVAAYARSHNIPIHGEDEKGPYILHWNRENNTAFKIRPLNDEAAIVSRVDRVRGDSINGAGAIYGLTGDGYRAYIFELGGPDTNHEAFYVTPGDSGSGSRIFHSYYPDDYDLHAAHVTGTIGAGFGADNGNACGMAPECELANRYVHNYSYAVANGASSSIPGTGGIVANNSYGDIATQGSYYGGTSQDYDNTMYGLSYWLLFSAAGNGNGTALFDKLFNVSKNGMNVAACDEALTDGYFDMSKIVRRVTSGMGPCDDGRIKPDITANGTNLRSVGSGTNGYATLSGTSMASPSAAGSSILIQELHADLNSGHIMISGLLRGLICHTATDIPRIYDPNSGKMIGQTGPDFAFGWGLFDTLTACDKVKADSDDPDNLHLTEATITNGTQNSYTFTWDGSSPLRATIAWTDPAGTFKLNGDTTPVLVNDLDLRLVAPNGTTNSPYAWNRSDPDYPDVPAITADNDRDNIEQVYIAAPSATGVWTVVISHKGTLTDGLQQYGLILDGQLWAQKEIAVLGNQTVIRDEDPLADFYDDTRFDPDTGIPTHTFTIANVGNVPLTLGADPVSLGGVDAGVFSVTQPVATQLMAGASTTFDVTYAPTASGVHDATISITNDDADEGPYNFVLKGETGDVQITAEVSELTVPEGSTNTFGVRLKSVPAASVTVTVTVFRLSGDTDIDVSGGESLIFTTNNWSAYQPVTLTAAQDEFWHNSTSIIRCASGLMTNVDVTAVEADDDTDPSTILPLSETFETGSDMADTPGTVHNQHGWIASGDALVQSSEVHIGTQALSLSNAVASHAFIGEATNVVITLWAKPIFSELPPENFDANAAAVFYVSTNNLLVAYSNTTPIEIAEAVVSNGWNKFEIECDYSSKVWNLSLNNVPVVGNFAFYGSPASFGLLEITEASRDFTAYIDNIQIANSLGDDSDGDGLPDSWEESYYGDLSPNPSDLSSNGVDSVYSAYIAGFDPTDPDARFALSNLSNVLWWNVASGRVYTIYWTSNLLNSFQPLETNYTGGAFTDSTHAAENEGFYKIEVEIEK